MSFIDWLVMGAYLAAMLAVAGVVGRGQNSRKDYYLGGNEMGALPLATSTIATQCSTNSLLGAILCYPCAIWCRNSGVAGVSNVRVKVIGVLE